MHIRRLLVPVALLLFINTSIGCIRDFQRRAATRTPPPRAPREMAQLPPVTAPNPPNPPPLPSADPPVVAPRSEAVTGIIPPIPNSNSMLTPGTVPPGAPDEVADRPIVPASSGEELISADGRPPIRDRLEELRKRAEERRGDRKEKRGDRKDPDAGTTPPPSPFAPKVGEPATSANSKAGGDAGFTAVRGLIDTAAKKWETVVDFEARLVKQEVVHGKQMPKDEILYRFRREPMSIYMKTLSESGQGREVMYVKGQYGDKLHVVLGKGDHRIFPPGFKTELDPNSPKATEKSRNKASEAGFSRPIEGLQMALAAAESGKPVGLKALGPVKRSEYPYPLEAIELVLRPGQDPLMPKGGKRLFYFDSKPDSPSHGLPVLIVAHEPDGREVEYYCFDRFLLPANIPASDWNPSRLGK